MSNLVDKFVALRQEIGKAVVGQENGVTALVIGLICNGHVLLEGVPGVAKTLLVRSLAQAMTLETKRIQFTPDLMPADVTGSLIFESQSSQFSFRPGPVFTNLLLADEINRTPPKTQSALLEAMEEHQVSADGKSMPLPEPFLVVATQNPVEYEGTYPLPEAQLDRFLLKVQMPLPNAEQEFEILSRHLEGFNPRDLAQAGVQAVTNGEDVLAARTQVAQVRLHPEVLRYIVQIVAATREHAGLELGVSPRGATALLATSRALAWLSGRDFATPEDVQDMALPTLAHRLRLHPGAQMDGATATSILRSILANTAVPH